ncbi:MULTISPECIES: MFS transporter [unclassified Streptomyces]|uniref:MFS transporter n=1 Tax=unclassified Streptomyces TaxID=2593676 RepID=UPI002366752D|nr:MULTISPECIES: MFS transporter [unclassified Streptomyces]MDF3140933.1 MFS transporter [Streptomyces sp. T21Q-yed]WDF43616.1 MFS transporter [Streptomyces sp. T12]
MRGPKPLAVSTRKPQTSWGTPAFRFLLGSEAASLSGSAVSTIALPALAVLELHATPGQVALLAFLGQLPSTLALWAGALADRYAKRPQLIVSDLAAAAALATIPAAALAGVLTIGQLYVVALVLGAAKVQHDAAAISLLPGIVAPHLLHDANAKLGAASSVASSAGSNAGAALVGAVGAARSVLADVASFLVSAVLVWRIRTPGPLAHPSRKRHSLGRDMAEGVRYVIGQPTIRTVIAALSTLSFGLAIMNTFWAYYLLTTLGASPTAFGVIMGVGGAGSLAGALFAPRISARIGVGPTIITGFAVSPLAQVPLFLADPGRGWQIALAVTLAVQLFWATASGTSQRSLRQIMCDPRFQGRMQAASTTVTAGSRPLAAATAGGLALLLDVRAVLVVGALFQVVPVVLLLASPVRALREMPAPPDSAAVPPAREGAS